jgi:hypothetical protein
LVIGVSSRVARRTFQYSKAIQHAGDVAPVGSGRQHLVKWHIRHGSQRLRLDSGGVALLFRKS